MNIDPVQQEPHSPNERLNVFYGGTGFRTFRPPHRRADQQVPIQSAKHQNRLREPVRDKEAVTQNTDGNGERELPKPSTRNNRFKRASQLVRLGSHARPPYDTLLRFATPIGVVRRSALHL